MTDDQELAARRRGVRKSKLRMRYKRRIQIEISNTLEKLGLLRELQSEGIE